MQTVKVEFVVGKESLEVYQFIAELIKDIKAKKDFSILAAENFPLLVKAIEGIGEVTEEQKSQFMLLTNAYGAALIGQAFLAK